MNNKVENVMITEEEERVIDIREIANVLISKALWIIICMAVFVAGAFIYTKAFVKPQYKTTAFVYVHDGNMSATNNIAVATYLAEDYVKTVMLPTVLETAIHNLGLEMSYQSLASKIRVSLEKESRIVEITVTDLSPERAQALCNEVCLVSKDRIEKKTFGERVSLYEEARLPLSPTGPSLVTNLLVAAIAGFVLPCAVFLAIYMLDDRIKNADDVQHGLKLSTLGDIPYRKD